jgi:hypothetical protein
VNHWGKAKAIFPNDPKNSEVETLAVGLPWEIQNLGVDPLWNFKFFQLEMQTTSQNACGVLDFDF